MRENSARGNSARAANPRAVSTVLDAALCLLLVTASALTLASVSAPQAHGTNGNPTAESADETAELLTTSTARVTYSADGGTRTAHDTLAGLLASAVRTDARTASPDISDAARSAFVEAVVERVERALRRTDASVQVVARRPPDRNASAESRVVVGNRPPGDADVHAAGLVARQVRFTVRTWSATRLPEATGSGRQAALRRWSA